MKKTMAINAESDWTQSEFVVFVIHSFVEPTIQRCCKGKVISQIGTK